MDIEENKKTVRAFIDRTVLGDESVVDELTTDDFILHSLGWTVPEDRNREFVKQNLGSSTFFYKSIVTEDMIAEEDKIAVRETVTIQYTGDKTFFNLKLVEGEKAITFPRYSIFRMKEGKIAEVWLLDNNLSQFQQLGLLPPTEEIGKS